MVVTSSSGEDEDVEASSRRMSNARSFESLKRHARQSASTAEAESIKLLVVVVILIIVRIYGSRDKREGKYFCAVAKSIFRRFLHLTNRRETSLPYRLSRTCALRTRPVALE